MFDRGAAVHDHRQSARGGYPRGLRADEPELEPQAVRPYGERLLRVSGPGPGTTETSTISIGLPASTASVNVRNAVRAVD